MAEKLCREGKQGRIKVEGTYAGIFTLDSKEGKILLIEKRQLDLLNSRVSLIIGYLFKEVP